MARRLLFTSESVSEGHPDKVCDQVSDAILDALLEQDPKSRVACECLATTGLLVIAGEITTQATINYPDIARKTILDIGYTSDDMGINGKTCAVMVALDRQSADIAMGVDQTDSKDQGAGDQGMMFGYACNETPALMPLPIDLAHRLAEQLAKVRREGVLDYLRPDGKTQVTVAYQANRPVKLETLVVSCQHIEGIDQRVLHQGVIAEVIEPVLARYDLPHDGYQTFINPTGKFEIGGPMADSGLTGRKIIVDTYGGMARHGGGAFSGKDSSKVDRSAAYAMRWVAKTVVAAGLADRCETQVAYAIGKANPVGLYVDTFGTGVVPDEAIQEAVLATFDLRPAAIVADLDLKRPIYSMLTNYGHFGRELPEMTWERTDRAAALANAVRA